MSKFTLSLAVVAEFLTQQAVSVDFIEDSQRLPDRSSARQR